LLRKGTYTITQCKKIELRIAAINQKFTNGVIVSRLLSYEIALSALSISITTRTDRLKVDALTLPSTK